jgi:tight adherence protein C
VIAVLVVCWVAVAFATHKLIVVRPAAADELGRLTGEEAPSSWKRTVQAAGIAAARLRARMGAVSSSQESDLAVLGDTVATFYGEKVVAALTLLAWVPAVILLGGHVPLAVAWTLVLGALGWFVPNVVVRAKAREARRELRNGVAEFALALSLAVAGGAGVDAAFRGSIDSCSGRFAREMGTARNLRPRISVRQVIDEVADRLGLLEASMLATAISATEHGAAVGDALDDLAWAMVEDRRIESMEAMVRASTKMVFITSALMVPGYLILVAFPGLRLALNTLASR